MMQMLKRASQILLVMTGISQATAYGQQLIQRGPFGKPQQVMDETQQWTSPLLVFSGHDVDMYIPDVTSPAWLQRNYTSFEGKGQYVLSMFTAYRTPAACRANQTGWGLGDAAHLDACLDIGYRLRQASVDTQAKTVTLLEAAMIGQDGQIQPGSLRRPEVTRRWSELDPNTQEALEKATSLVTRQMKEYDLRMQQRR